MREADVTMVSAGDEEVALDEADDEFAGKTPPGEGEDAVQWL